MNKLRSLVVVVVSTVAVIGVLGTPAAALGVGTSPTDGQPTDQLTDGLSAVTDTLSGGSGDDAASGAAEPLGSSGDDGHHDDGKDDGKDDCNDDCKDDGKDDDKDDCNDDCKDDDKDDCNDDCKDDGKDDDKDGYDDADQQNEQVNADDGSVNPNVLSGTSLTLALGPESFTIESPLGGKNASNDNTKWDGKKKGDSTQQSQQTNSDDNALDANLLNGNSAVIGIASENATGPDGGDTDSQANDNNQYNAREGDASQQNQQSNSDDDSLDLDLFNGNALAVDLLGTDTSAGDGGDTDSQTNDNDQGTQGCGHSDASQQNQQSNSDDDSIAAGVGNGNSGVLAIGSTDASSGDGGDTGTQYNDNWQTGGGCHGDTAQQSQQSNSDGDTISALLLNGNSLAGALGSEDTSAGDGGDTSTQYNRNSQEGGCDPAQQEQRSNTGEPTLPLELLNGMSLAEGGGDTNTTAGEGGQTDEQKNHSNQFVKC